MCLKTNRWQSGGFMLSNNVLALWLQIIQQTLMLRMWLMITYCLQTAAELKKDSASESVIRDGETEESGFLKKEEKYSRDTWSLLGITAFKRKIAPSVCSSSKKKCLFAFISWFFSQFWHKWLSSFTTSSMVNLKGEHKCSYGRTLNAKLLRVGRGSAFAWQQMPTGVWMG